MHEGLSALRENDLEDLLNDKEVMEGLWESSDAGAALYSELKRLAQSNISRTKLIKEQRTEVETLESSVNEAAKREQEMFNEWKSVEKSMHQSLYPISELGLTERLRLAADDSEARSRRIEEAILSDVSDVASKIRDFKAARAQMLLRRKILNT